MTIINTTPRANEVWRGIGGHFDSLTQVLAEFIDNSVSNFKAHNDLDQKDVSIRLEEDDMVHVIIEDTGTGIADLEVALKLGDCSMQESPMSEHGFGIKHALATADPHNESWEIWTRTQQEKDSNVVRKITAPYDFKMEVKQGSEDEIGSWPGSFNSAGTVIKFSCTRLLFETIRLGMRGNIRDFDLLTDLLVEALGHMYSGLLDGTFNLNVRTPNDNKSVRIIRPNVAQTYKSGSVKKDLGGGVVDIDYEFLKLAPPSDGMRRFYQRSLSTSGVEIRSNGRLIEDNLFKAIWDKESHPSYNHFKAIITLNTDNPSALPRTRSSKNGYREGDDKLDSLFEWIRTQMGTPPQENTPDVHETDLTSQLAEAYDKLLPAEDKVIEQEKHVFKDHAGHLRADLFLYDGTHRKVFEMKKDVVTVQDLYQLVMYWDGLVADGTPPDFGYLVAATMSPGIQDIIDRFNIMHDAEERQYRFEFKTWHELNIQYPA